jgi:SET domain-containing protein
MTNITFEKIEKVSEIKNTTDEFSFILKPSKIAGVGVFTTHPIKKGTRLLVFSGGGPGRKVRKSEAIKNPAMKKFIEFFAVVQDGWAYLPSSFSCMCVGWYLNHSDKPNAYHDDGYRYYANRDIDEGEELTINYYEL